jgi:hypothetical protein
MKIIVLDCISWVLGDSYLRDSHNSLKHEPCPIYYAS